MKLLFFILMTLNLSKAYSDAWDPKCGYPDNKNLFLFDKCMDDKLYKEYDKNREKCYAGKLKEGDTPAKCAARIEEGYQFSQKQHIQHLESYKKNVTFVKMTKYLDVCNPLMKPSEPDLDSEQYREHCKKTLENALTDQNQIEFCETSGPKDQQEKRECFLEIANNIFSFETLKDCVDDSSPSRCIRDRELVKISNNDIVRGNVGADIQCPPGNSPLNVNDSKLMKDISDKLKEKTKPSNSIDR